MNCLFRSRECEKNPNLEIVITVLIIFQNNIRKKTKGAGGRSTALMGLLEDGSDTPGDVRVVDHAWRGAEAYHYLMLCQVC